MVEEDCFSDWRPETSGVPQKLVLNPQLFVICLDDLYDNVEGMIDLFMDGTNICSAVANKGGYLVSTECTSIREMGKSNDK